MRPEAARYPREAARTRQFTLGRPRSFTVSRDGRRVLFLRSAAGDDPVQRLWVLDVGTGAERCVADPVALHHGAEEDLTPEERARRERAREQASGIVRYAADRDLRRAAFTLGPSAWVADVEAGGAAPLDVRPPVVDPHPDPEGQRIAFVRDGALHVAGLGGAEERCLVAPDDEDVTWGLAEFVAAEEMGRTRGFWWAPDGQRLAVARVDVAQVQRWYLTDPVEPASPPVTLRYPAAGSDNACVSLAVVGLDGGRVDVAWDRDAWPYLARCAWPQEGPLSLTVQSRDQRRLAVLTVDVATGATEVARLVEEHPWVELLPGLPRWADSRLLTAEVDASCDTRRLVVDGRAVSPPGLQVRGLIDADAGAALVTASAEDPTAIGVWRVPLDGGDAACLTPEPGVHAAAAGSGTLVVQSATLERSEIPTVVRGGQREHVLASHAARPPLDPEPIWLTLGARSLRAALLLPPGHDSSPLPVLLDPYGGPHAQRVLRRRAGFLAPQWFAEAGFAVLVTDGRGTPGRGPRWEAVVAGDFASAPLDDQVDALHAAAEAHPVLDLGRVAIRGWSFGGYLAALAVLRRPDVFHAAIAGAPVTEWRLYDTHYTERYLGLPQEQPQAYERSSLLADAARLERPLLLIHGLADDNVVAAHTLRLSRALLEAGRPHRVLPLSGITHMTPQETVAENLLLLQLDFLHEVCRLRAGVSGN